MEILPQNKSSDLDIFRQKFPTGVDILQVFSPTNWGTFLRQQDKCLTAPRITLAVLAQHYGQNTIGELVKQQFVGLYLLSPQKELNQKSVGMAADLFCSQYGSQITPYSLVLYFGQYPTRYKDTFREFDVQDILKQCTKFLRWWQSQQPPQEQQPDTPGISIEQAVRMFVAEGRTMQEWKEDSGLYRQGKITDAMIQRAKREVEQGIF